MSKIKKNVRDQGERFSNMRPNNSKTDHIDKLISDFPQYLQLCHIWLLRLWNSPFTQLWYKRFMELNFLTQLLLVDYACYNLTGEWEWRITWIIAIFIRIGKYYDKNREADATFSSEYFITAAVGGTQAIISAVPAYHAARNGGVLEIIDCTFPFMGVILNFGFTLYICLRKIISN